MQTIMKKTGIWVLVLALIVSVIPALPGVVDEVNAEDEPVAVDCVLDFINGDPTGDDFTWNETDQVLQLNSMNRDVSGTADAYSNIFILLPGGSKIVLNGNNSIKYASNGVGNFGIYATGGAITIEGSGSLNLDISEGTMGSVGVAVEGGNLIINSGTVVSSASHYGLLSTNKIIVNGGNINAKGTEFSGAVGDIQISDGKLISSGKYGISNTYFEDEPTNITMTGGEIISQATDSLFLTTPAFTLPDEYQYKLSESALFTSYSKTKGGTPYTPTLDQNYLNIKAVTVDPEKDTNTAPNKNTKFNSGIYGYKITDASTNGSGTVAVTGFAKGKSSKTLTIPNTVKYNGYTYKVTSIAKNVFKGNKKITTVKIGNNVKTIGDSAFNKCKNLKKVTIGTGLTKIGKSVFAQDTKLKTVIIKSKKLKSVGKSALKKTKKMKIKVPKAQVKKYKKLFKNKGQAKSVKVVKK